MRPTRSAITKLIWGACLIAATAGCGHVAANYPDLSAPKPWLPTEYTSRRGREGKLVWQDPGQVHGFLTLWRDTGERAAAFRKLAANSGSAVHREGAKMYADLSADGIAEITMWVFFGKNVRRPCRKGDFRIHFSDGTTTPDVGVLRLEPRDMEKPYRYTRDGGFTLSSDPVGDREPLFVILFVPAEYLSKEIESVVYTRGE